MRRGVPSSFVPVELFSIRLVSLRIYCPDSTYLFSGSPSWYRFVMKRYGRYESVSARRKSRAVNPARRPPAMMMPSQTIPVASTRAAGAPNESSGRAGTAGAKSKRLKAQVQQRQRRQQERAAPEPAGSPAKIQEAE